jgi:hypothetical protein
VFIENDSPGCRTAYGMRLRFIFARLSARHPFLIGLGSICQNEKTEHPYFYRVLPARRTAVRIPVDNSQTCITAAFVIRTAGSARLPVTIHGVEVTQMGDIADLVSVCRVLQMQGTGHADVLSRTSSAW